MPIIKTLKYLFDHILGLGARRNIFWAPVFGLTYYLIFAYAADFISTLVAPQLLRFEADPEIRHYMGVSVSLAVFYLVFGLLLIYSRRVHRRFPVWVLFVLSVSFAFFRVTHVMAAICVALISMFRGTTPFNPEIRTRALQGENVPTRASRPPPEARAVRSAAMKRRYGHIVATNAEADHEMDEMRSNPGGSVLKKTLPKKKAIQKSSSQKTSGQKSS